MFNREVAEFLAWLGEVETSLERLDGEGNPTMARLRDFQGEVRDMDKQACSGPFLRRNFTHSLMSCLPHATPPKCVTTFPRSLL